MFATRYQDSLIKEDDVGETSSSDLEMRNACNISDGKSERKISPRGCRQRWLVNSKTIGRKQDARGYGVSVSGLG